MKKLFFLVVAGVGLASFSAPVEEPEFDGFWLGEYGKGEEMKTMVVKFSDDRSIEWYRDEVKEENRQSGTYQLRGDSVIITCDCGEGKQFVLNGFVNRRKTYVDGNWQESEAKGSFYLKKQKVREFMTQP